MNEIIKEYIHWASCKKVIKGINIHHLPTNGWNAKLECVWESDMEISYKEVTYSCMWVAPYIWYCIWHRVFATTVVTCPVTLKVV